MSASPHAVPAAASWCSRATWSRPETWLGLLVALLALAPAWRFGEGWPGIDFYQFWLAGRAVHEGRVSDVYAPAERTRLGEEGFQEALRRAGPDATRKPTLELQVANYRRQLETFSTPLLYGVFGALASGDYARDKNGWQHASVALHALALLFLCAVFELPLVVAFLALAAFGVWFQPFAADIANANVNALLLAALAGALGALARGRCLLAGALVGLSLAFKPTLALAGLPLAGAWIAARAWTPLARAALGLGAGLGAGVGLGAWLGGGFGAWGRWLGELPGLWREGAAYEDNFALARWILDQLGFAPGAALAALLFAPCALVAWRGRASAPDGRASAGWLALGALLALLSPGLVWIHYYVLAIPAVLALLACGTPAVSAAAVLGALGLSVQAPSSWLGLADSAARAPLVLAGAGLCYAALLRALARARR